MSGAETGLDVQRAEEGLGILDEGISGGGLLGRLLGGWGGHSEGTKTLDQYGDSHIARGLEIGETWSDEFRMCSRNMCVFGSQCMCTIAL